jgi:hypothetical protein
MAHGDPASAHIGRPTNRYQAIIAPMAPPATALEPDELTSTMARTATKTSR